MADLDQHTNYTAAYSGLLTNLWLTIGIASACLVAYEIEVQIPRRRGREGTFQRVIVRVWRSMKRRRRRREKESAGGKLERDRARLGDRESWEYGYIFQPKSWALNRGPPLPRWPLMWIISSLRVRERDMPEKCGLDLTLHARFIRASFFYTLLQTCVVLPILLPLHILYAPGDTEKTSMLRAGINSLVRQDVSKWLWVHAVLIWYITLTWIGTTLWITWGALAYRRRELQKLSKRVKEARRNDSSVTLPGSDGAVVQAEEVDKWNVADESEGIKRFRTLMVINIPPDMRDEQTLRDYFDYYIHMYRVRKGQAQATGMMVPPHINGVRSSGDTVNTKPKSRLFHPGTIFRKQQAPKEADLPPVIPSFKEGTEVDERHLEDDAEMGMASEVDEVILVRKLGSIISLRERRTKVLRQLELAHLKLAHRVLAAVRHHKATNRQAGPKSPSRPPIEDNEGGMRGLNDAREQKLPSNMTKQERLDLLTAALSGFVDDEEEQRGYGAETVWDVLHSLPRELLDPYQALTHLKVTSVLRRKNAPLIDFLTTKLAYLTLLLDEARDKPMGEYQSASTAFVSFKDAQTARLALKILDNHPKRTLACHTSPAPDWTDILWHRLGRSVYRSEYVRGWVTFIAVWAFTLAWIFPVSFFCTLTTLTSIAGFLPPLENWLNANPRASSAISSLAPVILVALLTIAICPILLVIANKGQTIVTRVGIHNSVMERFWKFLMVNAVVFFAIGQGAIEAYLTAFQTADFDPLPIVAAAFPTAAPYFASYILLQVAIQPFFEIFRFGLPIIVYVFGTRVSVLPRQRHSRTEHPTFSHFSQVPYQLLGGAIMHLFMLLNPLVIPFTLIYYGMCYLVWKRQFTYVYGRLYETNGKRSSIRIMRYSLDALALGQFVLFAFFILNKKKGHAIATGVLFFLTLIAKLIITRALRRRFEDLDAEEADILCPPVVLSTGNEDVIPEKIKEMPPHVQEVTESRFAFTREKLMAWRDKWMYASKTRGSIQPAGYRRPIPFDHIFFAYLDKWIVFDPDEESRSEPTPVRLTSPSLNPLELSRPPAQAIHHDVAPALVVPHPPLAPWEDIPPYQRSRGYDDQPAYTDDYDDFLWLPRDPLSTLDLDDTVEMRLSLTTSAGGSGRIGDWPLEPMSHEDGDGAGQTVVGAEGEHEDGSETVQVTIDPPPPMSPVSDANLGRSPEAGSERHLLDEPELSPLIGSEVHHSDNMATFRSVAFAISAFRRPRAATIRSQETGISLHTLSSTQSTTTDTRLVAPAPETSSRPQRTDSSRSTMFLSPIRVPSPQPIAIRQASSPVPIDSTDHMEHLAERPPATAPVHVLSQSPMMASTPTKGISTGSERQLSFMPSPTTVHLGRSPSARRPSRFRAGSHTSDRSQGAGAGASAMLRSASIASGSGSRRISASQRALLNEVMEEERKASQGSKSAEAALMEKEKEEVMKEQERLRRGATGPGTLGLEERRASVMAGSGQRSRLASASAGRMASSDSGGQGPAQTTGGTV